jgi:hypothetical protein
VTPAAGAATTAGSAPVLPPDIPQIVFAGGGGDTAVVYAPRLLGQASIRFAAPKLGVDVTRAVAVLASVPPAATAAWQDGELLAAEPTPGPALPGAQWQSAGASAAQARNYPRWGKELADWLFRTQTLELFACARLKATSLADESERDFRIRLRDLWHEQRDAAADALRRKYAPRLERLQARVERASAAHERESNQLQQQKVQSAISIGATVLGAFLGGGRRGTVGRAATAARGVGRGRKEAADVERAEAGVASAQSDLQALDAEFKAELAALDAGFDAERETLETVVVRVKKVDIAVRAVSLAWVPRSA